LENVLQHKPESSLPSSEFIPVETSLYEEDGAGGQKFSVRKFNSKIIRKISIPYGLLFVLYLSGFVLGDLLLPILFVIFTAIISSRWLSIQTQFKEIKLDTVLEKRSLWHERLMRWNTFLTISCVLMAIFTSISLFIFLFSVGIPYIVILFLDGIFFYYINQKIKIDFKKHLNFKDKPAILSNDLVINFINIFVLFIFYFLYSLFLEHSALNFVHGSLDPDIPTWVKENIHHSCSSFEKILRISVALKLTFENLLSVDHWILLIYKIFHLLTMSFWPFVGITLFYRFFQIKKPISILKKHAS
jgi:hypothetical protein